MVVKSSVITITVTAPAPPAKPTVRVTRVYISASKTRATVGESVGITGRVSFDKAVPSGYEAFVDLTLKYRDPDGRTGTAGIKSVKASAGRYSAGPVGWTVELNKAGTWEFWIEAPDEAYLQPVGGR